MAITAKQPLIAMKPSLLNAALVVLLMAGTCANAAVDAVKAKELATKNACLGCHAIATRILGPSYKEVAARYERTRASMPTRSPHASGRVARASGAPSRCRHRPA